MVSHISIFLFAIIKKLFVSDWVLCKQRWTNIRDQYKKCLKSQKTSTGQATKKIKLYKFYEQLLFLKAVDQDRDKIENFVEGCETMPSPPSDITQSMSNDSDINQEAHSQAHDESLAAFSATNEQGELTSDLPIQEPQRKPSLKKKLSAPVPESASSTLMKYVLMNRNKNTEHTEKVEQHPIDAFLQGLAPTLKSFSPYLQHLAKGQIFQVIHNLELQQLTENIISSQSSPIIVSSPSPTSPSMGPGTQSGTLDPTQRSEQPGSLDPTQRSEQPRMLDSTQLSEQPLESIQLYFSKYDSGNV